MTKQETIAVCRQCFGTGPVTAGQSSEIAWARWNARHAATPDPEDADAPGIGE
ncbi:hypothetical protein [Candidatus Accumulibacter contiguus]|jgi:hypothetical protein|uniref:hypothetical protein n=1 Tax=Candidatus Accumulibacter contiguus TaxID=2954381 RepID=UPI002FC31D88